jgi:hypothetical protein
MTRTDLSPAPFRAAYRFFSHDCLFGGSPYPSDFDPEIPVNGGRTLAEWLSGERLPRSMTENYIPHVIWDEVMERLNPDDGYPDAVADLLFVLLTAVRAALRNAGDATAPGEHAASDPDAAVIAEYLTVSPGRTLAARTAFFAAAERAVRRAVAARMTEFVGDPEAVAHVAGSIFHSIRVAFVAMRRERRAA